MKAYHQACAESPYRPPFWFVFPWGKPVEIKLYTEYGFCIYSYQPLQL